jgi:hypothetical protein
MKLTIFLQLLWKEWNYAATPLIRLYDLQTDSFTFLHLPVYVFYHRVHLLQQVLIDCYRAVILRRVMTYFLLCVSSNIQYLLE